MDKLDRLGWAVGLTGRAYGLRIGIRLSEPGTLEHVRERLPAAWREARSPLVDRLYSLVVGGVDAKNPRLRRFHLAYADAVQLERALGLDEVLDAIESDLGSYLAENAPRHVFVHAGVVGWRGKAIVIPGKTLSGKSTLVAALVRAGATYLSDEFAVLDTRGRVHPYPRALQLRSAPTARPVRCPPWELGKVEGKSLPVGLVVSSRYRSGSRWRPRELSTGQGVLELLANTIPARTRPAAVLDALARAMAGARVLKGSRGEAAELAPELLAGLERSEGNPAQAHRPR